jgi:DNA repair exonuclease SbcCD nuclease subunit
MKILFTADVHIKLGQKNVPIEWAKNRFRLFVEQFQQMQEQADLVIIGGDVFDRLPTMDEVELYFDFVASFTKPTIIYPGNHEMLKKDTTFLTNLKKSTHRLNPLVTLVDDYYENIGFNLDIIPYNKLKDFEKHGHEFSGKILCTHVRGEIPPHVKPEVDLELFKRWDVVLAGDLHSYENSQLNILYPGSPYTTSFHRQQVDTGAIILDADTLTHVWLKFSLPQLIRKTVGVADPKPATDYDHTIYQVEGDMHELGELEDSDLIDRKVIKRDTDSALMLDPEMSLTEEVKEYLTYILELPDQTVEAVLKEMQNYAEKIESS